MLSLTRKGGKREDHTIALMRLMLFRRVIFLTGLAMWIPFIATAQEVSLFSEHFTREEFAARRNKVFDAIGANSIAVIQGEPSPRGYVRFRQSNEFYYLTGIESPHAYLVLDGASRKSTLFLRPRDRRREYGEGKLLSADDRDLIVKNAGTDNVEDLGNILNYLKGLTAERKRVLYTTFSPPEGLSESRDLALRLRKDISTDPMDLGKSREIRFMTRLRSNLRNGISVHKDLSGILDRLRLIKSPAEMELIRKATRLSGLGLMEAMRSTKPGMKEYELDAVAKYIFYRNGSQGDAYYSLIATAKNAYANHYNRGKSTMKDGDFLLMDYAPDYGYYMSDVTRMWPVNGTFTQDQRDLYGFYLACYKSILNNIESGKTAREIALKAAGEMEKHLAKAPFSKDIYQRAATKFVNEYKSRSANRKWLGHFVGMATHDVGGGAGGPLKAGMVFTIEPQFRVPEEKIYIRLEDIIIIHDDRVEIVSDFVPMEIDEIENLMKEEGMAQKYPREAIP